MLSDVFPKTKKFGLVLSAVLLIPLSAFATTESLSPTGTSDVFEHKEPELEFSLRIPPLWRAEVDSQGYAVVMKPSAKAERLKLPQGMIADPSLTVAVAKKPLIFDKEHLEKIGKEIEENFVRYNGPSTGFQIFQKNILTDLPFGKPAFLYYVSFRADGVDAGQAILITGNDKARYRVTLSDHRLNFDRNLELYYPYMTSLQFPQSVTAEKASEKLVSSYFHLWLIIFALLAAGIAFVVRVRKSRFESGELSNHPNLSLNPESDVSSLSSGFPLTNEQQSSIPVHSEVGVDSSSAIPQSMIGVSSSSVDKTNVSEGVLPPFSERDLSAPPESVPLSHVVNEDLATPGIKKRWQFFLKRKKE